MLSQLLPEIESGALVLTANRRLARSLSREYEESRRAGGPAAWKRPSILPLAAWLDGLWAGASLAGKVSGAPLPPARELSLWERIILGSEHGASLLRPRETAAEAAEAWALTRQYGVALRSGVLDVHPDGAAFLSWALEFERLCRERQTFGRAAMAGRLMAAGAVPAPRRAVLCGFDEFTPQQRQLLETLEQSGCDWARWDPAPCSGAEVWRACLPDRNAEYRAAARWARQRVEADGLRNVAVIVPSLAADRDRVERIFAEELQPGSLAQVAPGSRSAFHVSAGQPLARQPIVHAALLILRLAAERIEVEDASALLRSPYLAGGGAAERTRRAVFDMELRRSRQRTAPVSRLRGGLGEPAERFWARLSEVPRLQTLPEWRASISRLLEAAGWPGDAALTSAEYQTREAFEKLLNEFATAEWDPDRRFGLTSARERLRVLAEDAAYTPEDPGAPVQVMGIMEAAGSRFDALWVTGLDDSSWPQAPRPNAFLPLRVQRDCGMPHSSPEREYRFAATVTARLLAAAPQVVLSWPAVENGMALRPSALIPDVQLLSHHCAAAGWVAFTAERAVLEECDDTLAPPLNPAESAGGTRILNLQSACPFRAFAELRLAARTADSPCGGIAPTEKGNVLHRALDLFWAETGSSEALSSAAPETIAGRARRAVEAAMETRLAGTRLRELEIERLAALLVEWMELERSRSAFVVTGREVQRTREIAGVQIRGRLDRVDTMPDGTEVVIDYKTRAPSIKGWESERPAEPQLPFYAVTNGAPVAGVLFGSLNPAELKFAGIVNEGVAVPGVKCAPDLPQRLEEWKRVLERLAGDYAAGKAAVDPTPKACEFCSLPALCRIAETNRQQETGDA